MKFAARPYQIESFEACRDAFRRGLRSVIVECATGTGKTVTFAMMAEMTKERGKKTLILCNRDNLVKQAADKYFRITKDHPSVEKGEERGSRHSSVVIGSIQTMQGARLKGWRQDHFDLIIIDECHGSTARTFRNVLEHFEPARRIGFSATVERADQQGVGGYFEEIVYRFGIIDAINDGWLVPLDFQKIPVPVSLDDTIATKKKLTEEEEEYALEPYVSRLVTELGHMIAPHKSLVFFPECKPSMAAAQMLRDMHIDARHVDSTYMNKYQTDAAIDWFRDVKQGCLCNAQLLGVGYDNPSITAIGILRLIKSTPFFTQIIGRGTRALCDIDSMPDAAARRQLIADSAKPKCTIFDILIQSDNHNIAQPSCLISTLKDERDAIDKKMAKFNGSPVDINLMKAAVEEHRLSVNEKAEAMRKVADLAANAARKHQGKNIGDHPYIHDILQYEDAGPGISEKQSAALQRFGAKCDIETLTKLQASKIMGRYIKHFDRKKQLE